ncbi:hypothetical protein G7074_12000 [Pedobacter sp. HDW13]|uniref:hypothetical protein n=1 Tax=Pedobacter sp. HDW13 TaxID=2714940 RepID=UPI00140A1455|nr:hypothetical protein [Pedobacter sp. HDW13]QIL39924.1 hypothetical protein G7074_12000 [Pedobacter sp. HDW13]
MRYAFCDNGISFYKRLKLALPLLMKHLVTISLVFFSLTHLAKAERVEGLRILNEYCNEYKISSNATDKSIVQFNEQRNPYLLSYTRLALIGIQPQLKVAKYVSVNQVITDLTIRKKPKNNSP